MNKQTWILIFCMIGAQSYAQQTDSAQAGKQKGIAMAAAPATAPAERAEAARAATEKLAAKYQLNASQAKQAYRGQLQKLNNMQEIAPLRDSNLSAYIGKMQGIQEGALNSLRRVLTTNEQIALFEQTQKDLRLRRAEMRQNMMRQNASALEIELALLDLFVE